MPKTYRVRLSPQERDDLNALVQRRSGNAQPVKRALVLLAADESDLGPAWTDEQIAAVYPPSLNTVARLRQRFVEHGLETALHGLPRGPKQAARKFDGTTEAHSAPPRRAGSRCDAPTRRRTAQAGRSNCSPIRWWPSTTPSR